ncbi:MAG TPA: hypothetical protein PLL00_11995 [Bacteroidia bacterium]|nr:hypothetical protein [Bacteroidia bacterium]
MKTRNLFFALFIVINVCALASTRTQTPDSLGLPGDNLNLYGVLDLFKKSENPEAFEKALNSSDTKLNNLDLNGDGETDYIRVIDRSEKDMHAFVLQIPVNEDESQDVAVIEIEKESDGTAHLQIVGDEELYGKNYIVEPSEENSKAPAANSTPAQVQQSSPSNSSSTSAVATTPPPPVVNVWAWPTVRYVYQPVYAPWVSPWRWRYYPPYWKPWRPVGWAVYYPHWHPYHVHYRRGYTYRVVRVHDMYYSHRVVSRTVYQKRSVPGGAQGVHQQRRTTNRQQVAPGSNQQQRRAHQQGGGRRQDKGQIRQPRNPNGKSGGHSGGRRGGGKAGGESHRTR